MSSFPPERPTIEMGGTPLKKVPQTLQIPATVSFARQTSQHGYGEGNLAMGRKAVLNDLKRYLRVPFNRLARSIGQSATPVETAKVRDKLVKKGVIIEGVDGQQWKGFESAPADSRLTESYTFKPLVDIINAVLDECPNSNVKYEENPTVALLSSRNNTSRPDGYLKVKKTKTVASDKQGKNDRVHWFDIALACEFKKSNAPIHVRDNMQKIIWSLHNIMREDPCRRFALGITIENKELRLWLGNRAFLAVTEPIDFLSDINSVISLFHSLGSVNDAGLGWDNTVERLWVQGETQYRFTVFHEGKTTKFTTTRSLSTYGADSLVGRGTRVYEAIDDYGTKVAIKDSWRDNDRKQEGVIFRELIADIREKFPEEAAEAEKYFIRVREYGDVCIDDRASNSTDHSHTSSSTSISGAPDCTPDVTDDDGDDSSYAWVAIDAREAISGELHTPSVGHIPDIAQGIHLPAQLPKSIPIPRKTHTRTVFKDVGVAVQDMTKPMLADIIACLAHTLKALYYMHMVGWVYRDFSLGNALWVADLNGSGIGKLSDFEYSKKRTDQTVHDMRTGTMHFLAGEVDVGVYLFGPVAVRVGRTAFRMNPLHDIESVWWGILWTMLYHTDDACPTTVPDAQMAEFIKAFPGGGDHSRRHSLLTALYNLEAVEIVLSETCKPVGICISDFALDLVKSYQTAEASYPVITVDDALLEDVHKKTANHLASAQKLAEDIVLRRLEQSQKRQRSPSLDRAYVSSPTPMKKHRSSSSG